MNGDRRRRLAVAPEQLRRRVDPAALPFESTADVEPLVGTIGQPRALDAIRFGLDMATHGYNVFVSGTPGSGRSSTVGDYVARVAAERATPDDWVYVNDFADPDRPNVIRVPAGRGSALANQMADFVTAARREIPRAFESEEYDRRQRELFGDIAKRREELAAELVAFSDERGFRTQVTLAGVASTPLVEGKPLTKEEFERLPGQLQDEIARRSEHVREQTAAYLRQVRLLEKEAAERLRGLEHEVALFAVGPLLSDIREHFAAEDEVVTYLEAVQEDVLANLQAFRDGEEVLPFALVLGRKPDLSRYEVNVLVDNGTTTGAPVVEERNPTYYHLVGRMEYRAALGSMVTDFTQIKAGALHRANGGFLVLDALDVLRHPFAWEALKRALRSREARIENLGEEYSAVPAAALRPEPIPLDVKVVLIGSPLLYYLLYLLDESFRELFKVRADFAPDMDWSDEAEVGYGAFASRWVRAAGLRDFDRAAIARLVEHGARLREDQRKLSTRLIEISDVLSEASYWAGDAGHEIATAEDVDRAIAKREYRSDRIEERIRELIENRTIVIATEGERVGQVNGLSVVDLGDHAFGRPSRVTARAALGRRGVTSIEREIELSGPIHSKGVLVLAGYLAGTYAQDWPLAVSATITFEQSYDEVEGDSASSTELYALLSALSGLPLDQGVAVTGSVDQNGDVQAVGGVTRKVEGFFATCKAAGLNGRQGVLIPAANVPNLMLADEVVDGVREGRFHVWAVHTVDEGIELLTGVPAGELQPDGAYPDGSVHALVQERLMHYAERMRRLAAPAEEAESTPV